MAQGDVDAMPQQAELPLLGDALKAIRMRLRLSLRAMARELTADGCKMSSTYLYQIEEGLVPPPEGFFLQYLATLSRIHNEDRAAFGFLQRPASKQT